jgi:non-ribosomal peptide synthetase component F
MIGLPDAILHSLKNISSLLNISYFAILTASIHILLYRMNGLDDLCMGIPVNGRIIPGLGNTMGMFVNTTILRTKIKAGQDVRSILVNTNMAIIELIEHQHYPFDLILKEMNYPGMPYDILATYQVTGLDLSAISAFKGFSLSQVPVQQTFSKLPVAFNFLETKGSLSCNIEFDSSLYDDETIYILSEKYIKLLSGLNRHMHETPLQMDIELEMEKQVERREVRIDLNI